VRIGTDRELVQFGLLMPRTSFHFHRKCRGGLPLNGGGQTIRTTVGDGEALGVSVGDSDSCAANE
jgi:hypothetical protein